MTTSEQGRIWIEHFEGCELAAYKDSVGVWTIGYGHTGKDVFPGQVITKEQADKLLQSDLKWAENCVNTKIVVALLQNQFDALVSFTFNLGCKRLDDLASLVNGQQFVAAAAKMLRYDHAGGKQLAGLTKRRTAESQLFSGVTPQLN